VPDERTRGAASHRFRVFFIRSLSSYVRPRELGGHFSSSPPYSRVCSFSHPFPIPVRLRHRWLTFPGSSLPLSASCRGNNRLGALELSELAEPHVKSLATMTSIATQ